MRPKHRWTTARRLTGALLVVVGVVALADAGSTLVWQEPVGALQAAKAQKQLRSQYAVLARRWDDAPPHDYTKAMLRRAHVAGRLNKATQAGTPLGRLRIARIDLDEVWVQGTGGGSLAEGPGHYSGTVLPGRRGTVALAGHRTTHGAPFRHLDRLRSGDAIRVSMPYGAYTYRVEHTRIVKPSDVTVLRNVRADRLVLTACHPLWSAAERIVVTAKLTRWPGMLSLEGQRLPELRGV